MYRFPLEMKKKLEVFIRGKEVSKVSVDLESQFVLKYLSEMAKANKKGS
jgi:hypothetical protein